MLIAQPLELELVLRVQRFHVPSVLRAQWFHTLIAVLVINAVAAIWFTAKAIAMLVIKATATRCVLTVACALNRLCRRPGVLVRPVMLLCA